MSPDVRRLCIQQRLYNRRSVAAFQATAEVVDVLDNAGSFTRKMDNLRKRPMETIPEGEALEIEPAIKDAQTDEQLLKHFRPRPAQTGHVEEETNAHVALAQEQLTTDVAHLGDFLRGRLFDQYCLMRETPMDQKDRTWLKYGECIIAGHGNCKCDTSLFDETADTLEQGDPEVEDRLHRMINESGLDPKWVMDHIEGYHNGNEHIGHWQGYVRSRRWMNLAEKFTKDTQQLQRINSTRPMNSRRCNIMFNILSTTRLYFKRLDGPLGYELSDKACKMEREEDDES